MDTSAEAQVVASFTFIVALLLGAWGALDALLAGPSSFLASEPEPARVGIALLPFAATAVAFRASRATDLRWAQTLGGAAVMLGVLSSCGAVLYVVASW